MASGTGESSGGHDAELDELLDSKRQDKKYMFGHIYVVVHLRLNWFLSPCQSFRCSEE